MVAYNLGIPDGPNNPSNDQPKMKVNTDAIQTLISVDHVGFNTSGAPPNGVGGHHLQVSFDGKNVPGAQTDPQSVLYTNSGTASSVSSLYYRNQNNIFPISSVKAFGNFLFTVAGSVITINNQFNVSSIIVAGGNPYTFTITLNSNVTATNNAVVLYMTQTTTGNVLFPSYTFASNVLTLVTPNIGTATTLRVNFAIFQA